MHHIAAIVIAFTASICSADDYHLYFLGGQSNMDGFGLVSELPEHLNHEIDGVRIFLGQVTPDGKPTTGAGLWADLGPGFGTRARTDGIAVTRSDRFGPELTFAARLRELRPNEKIAIIKYAKGGSSLDVRRSDWGTWDPHDPRHNGINQYDHALAAIAAATSITDIDGDGTPDRLIPAGIVWMQGETDATNEETANDYRHNLAEMAELLRASLRTDDLPLVIGRISDSNAEHPDRDPVWEFGDVVRAAQAQVANDDPRASLVTTTDAYGYSDFAHYDSAGYIDLGRAFAEAIHELRGD